MKIRDLRGGEKHMDKEVQSSTVELFGCLGIVFLVGYGILKALQLVP